MAQNYKRQYREYSNNNADYLFTEVHRTPAGRKSNNNATYMKKNYAKESMEKDCVSDGKDKEGLFFSKGIVVVAIIMFVFMLFKVFTMEVPENGTLATVYVTAVTGVSAFVVTAVVWYLKKTHTAYVAKVEAQLYKDTIGVQYTYTVNLMKKQHELNITDQQMNKIENATSAKTLSNSVLTDAQSNVKASKSEGTSTIKKETGM